MTQGKIKHESAPSKAIDNLSDMAKYSHPGPLGALNQDGHPTSVYIQAKLNSGLVLVTSANLKGYAAWPAPLNLSSDLSSSESLAASNLGWSLFNPRNQQEVDESLANSPCTPGQDQAPTDTTTMTSGTKESDSGFTSQERREDIATSGASYSRHTSDGATATLNNPSSAVDTENQAGSVPIASMIPDATVSAPNHARRYLIAVAAVAGFLLGAMASAYLFPISESIRACASSNPCTIHDPQMANSSKALPDKSAPKAIRHGVCTIQMARISKDCPVHLDQGATRHDAGSQGRGRSLADSFNSCKLPSLPENMLDGIKSRVQEFRRSGKWAAWYMEFYPAAPPRLDSKQFRGIDSGRIDELVGQEQHGDHISSEGTPVSFSDASRQQLEHHVDASLDTDSPGGGNWVRDQNGRLLRREDGLEGVGASKFKADAPHVPTTI
eukprot:gene4322-14434_t